jgi:hypothetical protein
MPATDVTQNRPSEVDVNNQPRQFDCRVATADGERPGQGQVVEDTMPAPALVIARSPFASWRARRCRSW